MSVIRCLVLVSVLCIWSTEARLSRWKRRDVRPDWAKGANVCAVEEVMGNHKRYYSQCMPRLPRKICGKATFMTYHCCAGYEKTSEGETGCLGVSPIRDLMSTSKHLLLQEFRKYVEQSRLLERFSSTGPFTLFAPHSSAFKDIDIETRTLMSTTDQSKNLIRMHAAEGRYYAKDLTNGLEIPSLYYYQDEGLLKINKYSNGVRTVNCVRLILTDQIASNGIIHVTEKVIEPYPNRGTMMDILLRDDRFGELVTALIVSDLGNELRDGSGDYTIFAPTDRAFRSAPQEIINRILSDKELVKKLLRYHQTEDILCSAAILGPTRFRSREGQILNLTCGIDDLIRVNNVLVTESDIIAFNGVIHVIDELLIPDSVKSIGDIIEELDMGQFIEFAQQAGMQDILNGDAPGNYTIFVPRPEAFEALSPDQRLKLQTDSQFVKEILRYHVVPGLYTTKDMNDGQVLDTLSNSPVRITIYQKKHGVNSALIVDGDHECGNGVVHVVNKVLFPPVTSALEIIKQDPRLSTFQSLLETSGLDRRLDRSGHFTVFAPSNRAFDRLPRYFLEMLMRDGRELQKALGYHLLHKPVYTNGLRYGLQYRYRSLSDEWLRMTIKESESPLLLDGTVPVVESDIESTSGVIHIIDDVLRCPCVAGFQNL